MLDDDYDRMSGQSSDYDDGYRAEDDEEDGQEVGGMEHVEPGAPLMHWLELQGFSSEPTSWHSLS